MWQGVIVVLFASNRGNVAGVSVRMEVCALCGWLNMFDTIQSIFVGCLCRAPTIWCELVNMFIIGFIDLSHLLLFISFHISKVDSQFQPLFYQSPSVSWATSIWKCLGTLHSLKPTAKAPEKWWFLETTTFLLILLLRRPIFRGIFYKKKHTVNVPWESKGPCDPNATPRKKSGLITVRDY